MSEFYIYQFLDISKIMSFFNVTYCSCLFFRKRVEFFRKVQETVKFLSGYLGLKKNTIFNNNQFYTLSEIQIIISNRFYLNLRQFTFPH